MKLDPYDSDTFDLAAEELKCTKAEDEVFWKDMENLLRYGLPYSDAKGHSVEFRFRVRPIQGDIVAAIKEKMPEGWFKSQGNLYRCLLAGYIMSRLSPEMVRQALVSFEVRSGVHVYYSRSRQDIARWILDRAIKSYRIQREVKS